MVNDYYQKAKAKVNEHLPTILENPLIDKVGDIALAVAVGVITALEFAQAESLDNIDESLDNIEDMEKVQTIIDVENYNRGA